MNKVDEGLHGGRPKKHPFGYLRNGNPPSVSYLSGYLRYEPEIPPISPEAIMKAAGLIEQIGWGRMKMRKE